VVIISPWNYPFSIPFSEVVMALLAGNGVILKTASDTPQVGQALWTIFSQIDLPQGLFAYVSLPGKEAGPAFINGGIDKLFFTGSTAVGRQLMALAAPRLLPLVLELGGADAALVRSDADLDRAALGILWAGFSNAGQSCGGVQRVLVHRGVYDAFLEKLGRRVRSLRVGPASAWTTDMGPLTTARQRATVRDQVQRCVQAGARIVARSEGGDLDGDGAELEALVLADVRADMPIMGEEIFGPVVAVIPVADDQEALEIANRSPYSLTGSIWTRDRRQARSLAQGLNAGAIMVNDHLMSHGLAETPWGGFGDSGLGRTHGELGFHEMLKTKVVVEDILPGARKNIWGHPYSESVYRGLKGILTLLYGSAWKKRLAAIPGVIKIFFRYWDRS
jgi:succinate-semialdehyde dehydrogenase/glutarate-semialdehyde dehydrogenase